MSLRHFNLQSLKKPVANLPACLPQGFTLFTTFHDSHNYVHGTGSRVMHRYTTSCFVHGIMHWEGPLRR